MERGGVPRWGLALQVRRLWPDRNPLRRTTDRAEALAIALLLVAFLAGAPLAALTAADWVVASGLRTERTQAGWHRVPAVLLQDAPVPAGSLYYPAPMPQASASWPAPDGQLRTGQVYARPGAPAGSTMMVWTDRSGRLTGTPVQPDVTGQALLAGLLAPGVLALVLLAGWVIACDILDRRRLAAWDADWSATGPQWTGQR